MAKSSKKKESSKPSSKPAATPALSANLQAARANLDAQVKAGLDPAAANAEMARLQGLPDAEVGAALAKTPQQSTVAPGPPLPQPYVGEAGTPGLIDPNTPLKTNSEVLNAQGGLNNKYISDQVATNRLSEITPFGSSTYMQDPSGRTTRVSTVGNLNPQDIAGWTGEQFSNQSYIDRGLQAMMGEGGANNQGQPGLMPQLRGMLSKPFNYDGITAAPQANDYQADRARVEDDLYGRYSKVMEPQFQQQQQQLQQSLADRGITSGNRRYQTEMDDLARQQNDARGNLRSTSLQAGGQEQQRLFENTNNLRGQGINERLQQRAQPMQDMRGLLSMVNPVQMPNFNPTSEVNVLPSDVTSLATLDRTHEYNKELAKMGGGGGGGGGGGTDPFALAKFNSGLQAERDARQHQYSLETIKANQPKQPTSSDFWGNLGSGFFSNFLGGFGQSAGTGAANWFSF